MILDQQGLPKLKESGPVWTIVLSIFLHILVFVGVPFLLDYFYKEPKIDRPPTFELMALPTMEENFSTEVPTSTPEQPEEVEEPEPEPVAEPEEVVSTKQPEKKIEEKKPEPKKTEPKKEEKPKLSKQQVASELDNLFDGPPKKGGSNSSGSAAEMSYEGILKQRIRQSLKSTDNTRRITKIRISISRNGDLISKEMVQSSGNVLFDTQAKRAVELAFKMPSVPNEIAVPFVKVYDICSVDE